MQSLPSFIPSQNQCLLSLKYIEQHLSKFPSAMLHLQRTFIISYLGFLTEFAYDICLSLIYFVIAIVVPLVNLWKVFCIFVHAQGNFLSSVVREKSSMKLEQ